MNKIQSLYILFILFVIIGCKPKQNMVYMSNHNFEREVSQAKYNGLHIQEGDVLEITVSAFDAISVKPFNKSTMSQTSTSNGTQTGAQNGIISPNIYPVSSEGYINFPVLGNVYCKGMTKLQLRDDLLSRLMRYLTDPMVEVRLTNFNFSVLGEVAGAGQKTSPTEKLNIFQALALAGDIRESGNKTNVKIIRPSDEVGGKDKIYVLNLTESNITNSPYYYIQQNDIIYVEPDRNKQIEVNNNANVDKVIKYGGITLGILSLILTLTRLK